MKRKWVAIFTMSILMISAACSNEQEHSSKMNHDMNSNDWSHFVDMGVEAETIEAYDFAVNHPEVLDYIPCYCGCHHDAGHENNTDCFVDQVEDNVAVLDNMGLG